MGVDGEGESETGGKKEGRGAAKDDMRRGGGGGGRHACRQTCRHTKVFRFYGCWMGNTQPHTLRPSG